MNLQDVAEKSIDIAQRLGCEYVDARAERYTFQRVSADGDDIRHHYSSDKGVGVRVLKNGAWAFTSISHPKGVEQITEIIDKAARNAVHISNHKKTKVRLWDCPASVRAVKYPVKVIPEPDAAVEVARQCGDTCNEIAGIKRTLVNIAWCATRKVFCNSEGSNIVQEYTDTTGEVTVVAHDAGVSQSVRTTRGGRGGLEQVSHDESLLVESQDCAKKASKLTCARPAEEEMTTVVLNPNFVALLAHEIIGHPSEADRVMGGEMAWAGGAWWAGMKDAQIGSGLLTAFDDPTMEGTLGWYDFDDEGVRSLRTNLIEGGVLKNHFQSRETGPYFDAEPTANMRAVSYRHMPLLRMSCTCIKDGDFDPEEMTSDVKSGYLISGMGVPSIDMYRYNWSISCQYANKITNGEVGDLVKDVIVIGTAPEFFKSIDACGKDFATSPITNCGKGDPMQPMMMGNGGPSIRGVATVKSVKS